MKLHGNVIQPPKPLDVVFPRGDSSIHFKLAPLTDMNEFDGVYPEPPVPVMVKVGSDERVKCPDEPKYLEALKTRNKCFDGWMLWKALWATPGISWDIVDVKKPETFGKVKAELMQSGLTSGEVNHLFTKSVEINFLDDKKMEEAKNNFLSKQAAK